MILIRKHLIEITASVGTEFTQENVPLIMKQKIADKQKLRKRWQITRRPGIKERLNNGVKEIKKLLNQLKINAIQKHLEHLIATDPCDYFIGKPQNNQTTTITRPSF